MFANNHFPIYFQLDAQDCGPTCLRMIAKFYGKEISLETLRGHMYFTKVGVSLLGISDAAERLGFKTTGAQIALERLPEIDLPCILHWADEHFIVLYRISREKYFVADPAGGLLTYDRGQFIRQWARDSHEGKPIGIVLLLEPTIEFQRNEEAEKPSSDGGLRYLLAYFLKYRTLVFQLLIGVLASTLILSLLPFFAKSLVDVGIRNRDIKYISYIFLGQLTVFFGSISIEVIRRWILLHLSTRTSISLISNFLVSIMKLPLSFFDQKMMGDLLQRIEDHYRIDQFLTGSSLNILFSTLSFSIFGVVLLIYNGTIFLIYIGLSIMYILFVMSFQHKRAKIDYKRFTQLARNRGGLMELFQGMTEIKLNDCAKSKRLEWEKIQGKIFLLNVDSTKLLQYQESGGAFINELKNILITFVAASAVINNEISLGTMLSVQYIIGQLNVPLNDFVAFIRSWQDAKISLERLAEVGHLKKEDEEIGDKLIESIGDHEDISISNVSYHYEGPDSPRVLNDINLNIPSGKITAIVGTSGSGKTTLMKLLLKFYSPIDGGIHIGKQDLKFISNVIWRRKCGVVMQDGFIFSDTIFRNIALSDESLDIDRFRNAVAIANLDELMYSLPLGFNTVIGNSGVGLSAGQRQRILIARAVYKNPQFVFFDEATSALDAMNELAISNNLKRFLYGKTAIIIAHRLSTVKNADQIVVLNQGRIVEIGSHSYLVGLKGQYFDLVRNQLELGN